MKLNFFHYHHMNTHKLAIPAFRTAEPMALTAVWTVWSSWVNSPVACCTFVHVPFIYLQSQIVSQHHENSESCVWQLLWLENNFVILTLCFFCACMMNLVSVIQFESKASPLWDMSEWRIFKDLKFI